METAGPRPGTAFVSWVIRYYRISILVVGALMLAGLWTLFSLPRSEDPEFDVFASRIVVAFPGASPETVESLVTDPVEEAVAGLDGIKRIESLSVAGLSFLKITLAPDAVPSEVVAAIRDEVSEVRPDLPDRVQEPVVVGFSTADIPVAIVSLAGDAGYAELDRLARRLRRELESITAVSRVNIEGLPERQVLVDVNNQRLAQLRIPLIRVHQVLGLENAAIPGGTLDVGSTRYVVRNPNQLDSLEQIQDTVIGSSGNSVITVRDVAQIRDGFEEPRYLVRTNRQRAVLLEVVRRQGTNTVEVAEAVRSTVARSGATLPAGLELRIVSDQGESVSDLLGTLGWNALGGGLIVVLMVGFFLGRREGVVVSVSIPMSVLIALILFWVSGIGLNQVSIFGLVLALGMLVDSGLVVVENIGRHLEEGAGIDRAVVVGIDEVKAPVLSSALTTIAAFVPILFLAGDTGVFIYPMPMAVIFALSGSLLVSLTVIPLLCYALWRRSPPPLPRDPEGSRFLNAYTELAKMALRNRMVTLLISLGVFALSVVTIPLLGFQLFPNAEKSFFLIDVRLPWEANLRTTDLVASQVEEVLAGEARVRDFTTNIGKGNPLVYYNVERERERASYAQLLVNLHPGDSAESFVPTLAPRLAGIAGASVEAKTLQQGPAPAAPIQVIVAGPELGTLARLAGEIRRRIAGVPGIVDLRDTMGERRPQLALDLDRTKAALLGVDSFSFSRTVFMALNGETATRYRVDGDEVPVVVRLDRESIREVSGLEQLYLPTIQGTVVPFSEIAAVREEPAFAQISHRNRQRSVSVEAGASGRLADEVLNDIQRILADFQVPDGYRLSYGGERAEREESFAGLGQALFLALVLIYGLLAIQFNSFVQPLVILLTVPFGITGAVFGLLVTNNPFGFMAFIGIVSLTGIIINDSIVLTDFANYLQRVQGKGRFEALLEAGRIRLRPVILTSVTTIGGLLPLAIWGGTLWSPLACAVIFGLVGSTALILLVLPVIYALLVRPAEGRREYRLWAVLQKRLLD